MQTHLKMMEANGHTELYRHMFRTNEPSLRAQQADRRAQIQSVQNYIHPHLRVKPVMDEIAARFENFYRTTLPPLDGGYYDTDALEESVTRYINAVNMLPDVIALLRRAMAAGLLTKKSA